MKKTTKITIIVLALTMILALCLVGCGGDNPTPPPADTEGSTESGTESGTEGGTTTAKIPYTTIAELKEYAPKTAFDALNTVVTNHYASNPLSAKPENFNANNIVWNIKKENDTTIKEAVGVYMTEARGKFLYKIRLGKSVNEFLNYDAAALNMTVSIERFQPKAEKVDPYQTIADEWAKHKGFDDVLDKYAGKSSSSTETDTIYKIFVVKKDADYTASITVPAGDSVEAVVEKIKAGTIEPTVEDDVKHGDFIVDKTAVDKAKPAA